MLKSLSGIHVLYLNSINLGSYLDDVDGVDFIPGGCIYLGLSQISFFI